MIQSSSNFVAPPRHVAVIMDGNGRWAAARGLARVDGHRRGADAVRRTVEAAAALGITTLTLYAFSADNWKRPTGEVQALMGLFRDFLRSEALPLCERGVRLTVIGRRDRLPGPVRRAIAAAQAVTVAGRGLHLRVAVDYSARDAIVTAARGLRGSREATRDAFARRLGRAYGGGEAPDVDLLIRTGGEHRLSDFLLWECAYAELWFTSRMWPDFGPGDLAAAVADFQRRERRFGALPETTLGGDRR